MVAPLRDVFQWMVTTLEGDATLQGLGYASVYVNQAPKNADFPYWIVQKQTGNFRFTQDSNRAYDQHFVALKAVQKNTETTSDGGDNGRQALDRAREILVFQQPSLTAGTTMVIKESSAFEFREAEEANEVFYHTGVVLLIMLAH